jgi:uridine phosphorylase
MIAHQTNQDQRIAETELILRPDGSVYHLGVRPEHVANKVIIVGDPERVPLISALFDEVEVRISGREFVVHTGTYHGKRITIVSSGIGVDNIDIVINELDAAVNIDFQTRLPKKELTQLEIVRIGTSGTVQADIAVGSFVASAAAFGLDGVPHSYASTYNETEAQLVDALRTRFAHLRDSSGLYAVTADKSLLDRIAFDSYQGITATANGFYGPQGRSVRLKSLMTERIDDYADFRFDKWRLTNFEMECAGIYALASLLGHKALTVCAILANRATKEFHSNPSASIETLIRQVIQRF